MEHGVSFYNIKQKERRIHHVPLDYSKSKLNEIFSDVNILFTDNIEETISDYVIRG